jgi:tetratricopeptide (TPR) repeat protein
VTSYSRQDVLRILQIGPRQLQGWERAGLIAQQQTYTFQDLGQLRTLRVLRAEDVSAASIRHSILAMKAVAGMENPLLEASLVRTGTRLAFRHHGFMMDPIRRQFLFDFERVDRDRAVTEPAPLRRVGAANPRGVQDLFLAAVEAEEAGEKQRATGLYERIIEQEPGYAPAYINLGTIHFHQHQYARAEDLYRQATEADPGYVLGFFDLGNVLDELQRLDESIVAYRRAIALAPRYADAHYNWPTSGRANAGWPCGTGRPMPGWTTEAPGPTMRADRSASCSAAKSWPLHGAPRALLHPTREPRL